MPESSRNRTAQPAQTRVELTFWSHDDRWVYTNVAGQSGCRSALKAFIVGRSGCRRDHPAGSQGSQLLRERRTAGHARCAGLCKGTEGQRHGREPPDAPQAHGACCFCSVLRNAAELWEQVWPVRANRSSHSESCRPRGLICTRRVQGEGRCMSAGVTYATRSTRSNSRVAAEARWNLVGDTGWRWASVWYNLGLHKATSNDALE